MQTDMKLLRMHQVLLQNVQMIQQLATNDWFLTIY